MSKKDSTTINSLVNNSGYIEDDNDSCHVQTKAHVGEWVLGQ